MIRLPHKVLMTLNIDTRWPTTDQQYRRRVYLKYRQSGYTATGAWNVAKISQSTAYVPIKYYTVYPQKGYTRWVDVDTVFRDLRYADEICASIKHTGWYTDDLQDSTLRGIVIRLPHNRFIVGYYERDCGYCLYTDVIYTDKIDAAHAANDLARVRANDLRDYNSAWNAGYNYARCAEEIDQIKDDIREVAKIPVRNDNIRRIGDRLFEQLIDVYGNMHELLKVPYTDDMRRAFNEGRNSWC